MTVKAGISRVVWKRPRDSLKHRRRSVTSTESIPFLAIARSLGQCRMSTLVYNCNCVSLSSVDVLVALADKYFNSNSCLFLLHYCSSVHFDYISCCVSVKCLPVVWSLSTRRDIITQDLSE